MNRKNYLSKENVESIWELSLLQKQIFRQISEEKHRKDHFIRIAFTIKGRLQPDRIREAWQLTVQRTPLLRTILRSARNRMVQVVMKEWPLPVETLDQPPLFPPGPGEPKTINLMEDPAVSIRLFRESEGKAVILLSCHRIIMDKSGLFSVFKDFLAIYDSLLAGGAIPAVRRTPFKNYLDWLAQQYWVPALARWEKELSDFEPPGSLARHRSLNKNESYPYTVRFQELSAEISAGLEHLTRQFETSPDILMQAAWALLLSLHSREKEVIFGVEVHGPPSHENFQTVIGPFANTLPLRVTIDVNHNLEDLITNLREKNTRILRDAFIPLEEIKTNAGLEPGTGLFETSVSINGTGINPGWETPYVTLEKVRVWQRRDTGFALDFTTGGQWQLQLYCFKKEVSPDFSLELLDRLAILLEQIQKSPGARLSQMDFLSGKDLELINKANTSQVTHIPSQTLGCFMPSIFEKQVEKTPAAVTCTFGERQVTYGELNIRANRLAHRLKEMGIGPNRLVGILGSRNIEMLTAVLAVFKAGGAYIPLDPDSPDSRLGTMIADSGAQVIFTQQDHVRRVRELAAGLPFTSTPTIFCLDPLPGDLNIDNITQVGGYPVDNPALIHGPRDLAYVIFTSGSTGVPKGAMVEHIGMINHLWTKIELLRLTQSDRVAQNASHCFDISVWQLLAALLVGGQTVIYNNEVAMDPVTLMESVRSHRVTILELVPAVLEMVLQEVPLELPPPQLPHLRRMMSTGEALPASLCRKWLEAYPAIPVVNAYGPTECSDDTHHKIVPAPQQPEEHYNEVPLGKVIPNFNVYILNEDKKMLPPGCPGEICLTGIGVGKGYLNNPERTVEVFVKNPFDDGMGDRMYRTGDLGYLDYQGDLVFLGRLDHQVKVRGHRIELGEIETRLRKHHGVRQCVAIIRKNSINQPRILAYVVLKDRVSSAELRDYLQQQLSEYMIPEHILQLEKLPLNRSGKIDHKALPEPGPDQQTHLEPVLPRNDVEKALTQIWENVLEISPIGINHNFFQLGGHSLKVIQVRSRINQQFGINISVMELFQKQTIALQANVIEEHLGKGTAPGRQQIPKQPEAPYYPLSHAQQRVFFVQHIEPDNTGYNLPTAIELCEPFQPEPFKKALQKLSNRHASLRTTFALANNKPVQSVAANYEISFKVENLSHLKPGEQEQKLAKRLGEEAFFRFNLTAGPLFYTIIFKLEEERWLLFFNMHHIIGDLWSWEVLFRELFILYRSEIEGKNVTLPPLPIQYIDYAAWQNQQLEKGDFQVHADYWQENLSGELPVLELPTDFPRQKTQKFRGGSVHRVLPEESMNPFRQFLQKQQTTLFIGLMASFYAFLTRITAQQDIIIGTFEAGRNQVETENLIGFFVNTLPIRIHLEGEPTFQDVLNHVKKTSLEAVEHAAYPFDLIIEQLNLPRDLSRHPLFSVMFQVNEEDEFQWGTDVSAREYPLGINSTNYDFHAVFTRNNGELHCSFGYCKDLFKDETVERWLEHFVVFFENVMASPGNNIVNVPLLTVLQRNQILMEWNATHVEYSREANVHTLFEDRVEKNPDSRALVFKDRALSYSVLNRQADRLAGFLIEKGIRPGDFVGIFMERSLDMIIGMLGILKAGAAYMPLAPAMPMERLGYMISNSNLSVTVTAGGADALEKKFPHLRIINIREQRLDSYQGGNYSIRVPAQALAYSIYTSGTTGKPKGVPITHSSLVNFIFAMTSLFKFKDNIMLAVTNLSFDIAFLELMVPLTAGGTVVIAHDEEKRDGELLKAKVVSQCPDIMQGTPATWKMLLHGQWQGNPHLVCLVGGEELTLELAQALQAKCNSLWNMYGPTEATIWASVYNIPRGPQFVSIGRPFNNTRMYILNASLSPVPVGVTGELYIAGECLSPGYLNSPELTREKFPANPFDNRPGACMYRTGDLVRFQENGNIEFLGRIDHQVKIRGYRIELNDIETHLLKAAGIKECVLLVKKDKTSEKYLCAYIVTDDPQTSSQPLDTGKLREHLLKELPEYMIPSRFFQVDNIPLSSSGKVDRNTLTKTGKNMITGEEFQPPENIIEDIMVNQWKDVLELNSVGVTDNFFQLGGHSLKAFELIAKLNEKGIQVSLNELFKCQTIRQLARYIDNISGKDVYRVHTAEEALQAFEREFNANGEFVEYHLPQESYRVFYLEDSNYSQYKRILQFFSRTLSEKICPHFIRPLSQKPEINENRMELDGQRFTGILQLKDDTPSLPDTLEADIKADMARFNGAIISNNTVKQYRLSPMQQNHLTLQNRLARTLIVFDKHLDIALLENAFLELIRNQGLLRSVLIKENGELRWNEFDAPEQIKIPCIDLTDYDLEVKEKILSDLINRETIEGFQEEHTILYNVILVKKDLRNHLLIISFDHSIFDGMSGEIIKRNLVNSYYLGERNREIHLPKPKAYSDYIKQISMGPQEITEEEILDLFDLKEYHRYKRKVETIIREKEADDVRRFDFEMKFQEKMSEEKVWELSFYIYNLFLKRLFGLSRIPLKIVSYGRRYRENNYFDTVGEFIDLIPVLVNVDDDNPINLAEAVRRQVDISSKHNINFMSLLLDQSLQKDWKEAVRCIGAEQLDPNDFMVVFNFVGKITEEVNQQVKQLRIRPNEGRLSSLFCEVYYTSYSLIFSLSTSMAIEAPDPVELEQEFKRFTAKGKN